jgi:ferric-dicitrate binding protein FerR (iron transport regulator)
MALGAAAWLFSGKKPRPLTAAAGKYTTIPTNHNRAVLVLEDGRNVDLGSDRSSHIRQGQAELTHTDSAALRYTATGASQPAGVNTLYIPRGAKYKVELADGSEIWLNAESKLRYPVAFGGASKREVFLESGEAYFKVRKNTALPFIVHTKGMAVEVLGTEFDVNTYSKTVATTLVLGSVRLNAGVAAATLRPGEQGILTEDKFTSSKVETELYTAWVNNQMLCVETPLEDVMESLGREYDFTVDYASPQLRERRFGGRLIMAEHIEDVLAIIEQTAYVKFSIKGKTILVSPDSSR